MRANSLGALALYLTAGVGMAGLTSCSRYSFNSSNGSTPPQGGPSPTAANKPHVYVATDPHIENGDPSQPASTYGFSVADDGQLSQINGFPLAYFLRGVISGNYFFSADADGVHIDSYRINPDGSLAKVQSFDDTQASAQACSECTPGVPLLADRTGSKLYVTAGWLDGGDYESYLQTFAINSSNGAISYVSSDMRIDGRDWGQQLGWFSGDGAFLYGTNETPFSTNVFFATQSPDGSLAERSTTGPVMSGLPSASQNSMVIGTDTTNHLVAAFQSTDANLNPFGAIKLASFTINSDGTLTTTNSGAEIPVAPSWVGSVSPDGTLIAMAGATGGIQIFKFNGASPIAAIGGTLSTDAIAQLSWDKQNHLYGLAYSQKLYVFNVTSTSGATAAPGSPHAIRNASGLLVQP